MHAIIVLTFLGLTLGYLLGVAAQRFRVEADPVVEKVEALLPGTNCGQCGFAGCPQAASMIASGEATVTICPPGGKDLAQELAAMLGVSADLSSMGDDGPKLARVDETKCIGCIKCFRDCPTDAIVGAPKQIHVVLWEACTGCGVCVDVCPTECITLFEPGTSLREWRWPKPEPELNPQPALAAA